jgi:hypothetical protein
MDDHFVQVFHSLVRNTRKSYGYELPQLVEQYVVLLLADHINRPDWMPENSFAEAYMLIQNSRDAKVLGDECLFLCGVFPEYGKRRGLDVDYYANIGSGSYSRASRELHHALFDDLSQNFKVVSKFINTAVRNTSLMS